MSKSKQTSKQVVEKEVKEFQNAGCAKIHASLNVTLAKKEINRYVKEVVNQELASSNSHYAYTVIAETVLLYLVRASSKYIKKDSTKAGVYDVTLDSLQRSIREADDFDFGSEFKHLALTHYNNTTNYKKSFFETEKNLMSFLESKSFENKSNFQIDSNALNFLCFVTNNVLARVTEYACSYSLFANKKTIAFKNYSFVANVYFTGNLKDVLVKRLDEAERLVKKSDNDENQNEQATKSNEEVGDDEDDDSGTDSKKPTKTSSKKVVKQQDSDDESDDESDDGDEKPTKTSSKKVVKQQDSDDESDDDDEKPVKNKKRNVLKK